jgi:hypothetical protein
VSEKTDKIVHIPKALYKTRHTIGNDANDSKHNINFAEHQADIVNAHLQRQNIPVVCNVNTKHPSCLSLLPIDDGSKFSARVVLIPSISNSKRKNRLNSENIIERTDHLNIDWTILDKSNLNNLSWLPPLLDECKNDFWVFLNTNCEPLKKNWLNSLLSFAALPGVGAVGPILVDKKGKKASVGNLLTTDGIKPAMKDMKSLEFGYDNSLNCLRDVSVLSPDCLVVRASVLSTNKQFFNEFGLAYNIIDSLVSGKSLGFSYLLVPFVKFRWISPIKSCLDDAQVGRYFWINYRRKELSKNDAFR